MSPKPKDDREEPEDGAGEEARGAEGGGSEGGDAKQAAAAYGRRTITKSGKFPKSPSSSSSKSSSKSSVPPVSIREEAKLMGSTSTSRYTLVAPRTGKKKKADPPAE